MASEQDTPDQPEDTTPAPRKRAARRAAAPVGAPAAAESESGGTTESAKKAPRKRAARKKAAAVAETTQPEAAPEPTEVGAPEDETKPAAPRKRAARKKTPRKVAKDVPAQGADSDSATPETTAVVAEPDAVAPVAVAPTRESDAGTDLPAEEPEKKSGAKRRSSRRATTGASRSRQASVPEETTEDVVETPVSDLVVTELTEEETEALLAEGALLAAAAAQEQDPTPVPTFGLIFQAPEATPAPRRRRASAAAGAPGESVIEVVASSESTESTAPEEDGDDSLGAESDSDSGRRRRRRGGKGRRRSSGDDVEDTDTEVAGAETAGEESGPEARTEEDETQSSGRRRTRRRRRSGSAGDSDDPPGTVTKVREPRRERDEATGIKGSTRLEAKKQRRREGREAGRRRTIITEAEFLARRESVERVMVVRQQAERTQIGVLEDGILVEHYVSKADSGQSGSMAGNVYLGRVQNVLPSMEAAFVDIGRGRNAVLYAGEVNWDAAGLEAHKSRRIENALSSGQSVLVQVTKDPIGHKGARLTSQISLPGRYLVYVPNGRMTGISRKLPDTERSRLKKILKEVVPADAGVIVRTAAEGASEAELRADVERLTKLWEGIQKKASGGNAPALLHGEVDLTVKVIRDVFNEDFASMVVSGENAWNTVNEYMGGVAPDLVARLTRWTGEKDVFASYRIDEQLAKAMDRKVWLPSGGSLVIDRTEAMTVIDVNTGKFVGAGGNLEETVTKNNIEAAEEIVRQLRLRDIGGIIVIDFIDMVLESNRDLVVRRLLECLGRDRTKHQVAEVTSLGLVQMTRKRVGAGLIEVFSQPCEHCNGRGIIVSSTPVDQAGPTSSGGGNSAGSSQQSEGGRRRRGKGSGNAGNNSGAAAEQPAPVAAQPEPEQPKQSGPTPAQIAAAAYAALRPGRPEDGEFVGEEPADTAERDELVSEAAVERQEAPVTVVVEAVEIVEAVEAVEAVAAAPEKERPVRTGRVRRGASRQAGVAGADSAGSDESATLVSVAVVDEVAPVVEQVTVAKPARRRRARVVAPAGPPRSAAGEDES